MWVGNNDIMQCGGDESHVRVMQKMGVNKEDGEKMCTWNSSIASASPSWPVREKAFMLRAEPYLAAVKM
jgi:hypothetical protein